MKALTSLISNICTLFSMHPARKETLSAMIFGTMVSGNVHHIDLSRYLSTLKPEHALRRVQRFFQHQDLELSDAARSMIAFLKFEGKFDLCLDRTNWKFGDKDINYLVLSWRINRFVTIPLLATELDKAGNSNAKERIDLLKRFGELFGFERIKALIADREFIGDAWFRELLKWDFPFFVRVKENGLVPYGDNPIHVKVLFDHLKNGEYRKVEKDMYGSTVYFSGTRAETGDLVIVISNQSYSPRTILNTYRKRWSIEEMFRKLKTSGFHWENTHMKESSRLLKLLAILSIAALLLYCMGVDSKTPWKRTLKCPLWSLFRQGMINFQHAVAKGVEVALELLLNSLARADRVLGFKK